MKQEILHLRTYNQKHCENNDGSLTMEGLLIKTPRTQEVKDKISMANSGTKNGMYGKKPNENQLRGLLLGRKWNKGKKSPEISKRMIGENNPMYGMCGELNPNWRGGKTNHNKLLRTSDRYLKWRTTVFERDGYSCKNCGDGQKLEAHHSIPIRKLLGTIFEKYIFDVKNGVTLCHSCHEVTYPYGSKN